MTVQEYHEKEKEIFTTLLKTVKEHDEYSHMGSRYLESVFSDCDISCLCQFIGMSTVVFSKEKKISKTLAVRVFSEIAMAGIILARQEGYGDAKNVYGGTYLKKELGATA
jgi:hypothetical protein